MKRGGWYLRPQRIEWLAARSDAWRGFPTERKRLSDLEREMWRNLVVEMKNVGLLSHKTIWFDVNMVALVNAARERIGVHEPRT